MFKKRINRVRNGVAAALSVMNGLLFAQTPGASPAPESSNQTRPRAPQTPRERARELAENAFASLDSARYAQAVEQFSEAIQLYDAPTLRVGRADSLMHVGRWLDASVDYSAAVDYPLQPNDSIYLAESQNAARAKLNALRPRIPRLRVDTDAPSVQVTVDTHEPVRLLTNETLNLDPGEHRISIETPNGSAVHTLIATEGEVLIVEGPKPMMPPSVPPLRIKPTPVALRQASTSNPEDSPTEIVVAGALTATVLVLAGAATGIWFLDSRARYEDERDDPTVPYEEKSDDYEALDVLGKVNTAVWIGAAAAAGITSYLWFAPVSNGRDGQGAPNPVPQGMIWGIGERF